MNQSEPHSEPNTWRLAAGSVRGRDHSLSLRNNQDGLAVRIGDINVAVLTDGCSSGAANEAGAKLGAEVLANAVARFAADGLDARLATRACDRLFVWLYESARAVATGEALAPVVERFFLFSFLCAVTSGDESMIFGVGDGVWGVDGVLHAIDSGPENAPPYLGYRALPGAVRASPQPPFGPGEVPPEYHPVTHHLGCARSLLIATDGLASALAQDAALPRHWSSDAHTFTNPAHLNRQLVILAEQRKWLRDDTTVALLERR